MLGYRSISYNYLFSLGVTDPEEGLEEVRVSEGEWDEGEEGAESVNSYL
jgi:hypothetical protein